MKSQRLRNRERAGGCLPWLPAQTYGSIIGGGRPALRMRADLLTFVADKGDRSKYKCVLVVGNYALAGCNETDVYKVTVADAITTCIEGDGEVATLLLTRRFSSGSMDGDEQMSKGTGGCFSPYDDRGGDLLPSRRKWNSDELGIDENCRI